MAKKSIKDDDIVVTDNGNTYETQESTLTAKQYAEEAKLEANRAEENANLAEQSIDITANYKDLAKNWATKTDGKVIENSVEVDYSSKYYAQETKSTYNATVKAGNEEVQKATNAAEAAALSALSAAESAKNVNQRSETIYTSQKDLGNVSGDLTVTLEPDYFEYSVTAEGNINFTFDFSNVDLSRIITFALHIKQSDNHTYAYNFGEETNFTWLDEIAATPRGSYLLTFRRYPDGNIVGTPIGQMS